MQPCAVCPGNGAGCSPSMWANDDDDDNDDDDGRTDLAIISHCRAITSQFFLRAALH